MDNQTHTIFCPRCSERYRISLADAHRQVRCPACNFVFFATDGAQPRPALTGISVPPSVTAYRLDYAGASNRTLEFHHGDEGVDLNAIPRIALHMIRMCATGLMLVFIVCAEMLAPYVLSPMIGIPLLLILIWGFGFWWVAGAFLAVLALALISAWLAYD